MQVSPALRSASAVLLRLLHRWQLQPRCLAPALAQPWNQQQLAGAALVDWYGENGTRQEQRTLHGRRAEGR
jgi:hypothetical protein